MTPSELRQCAPGTVVTWRPTGDRGVIDDVLLEGHDLVLIHWRGWLLLDHHIPTDAHHIALGHPLIDPPKEKETDE